MDTQKVKEMAEGIRQRNGGIIFAFPVEEEEPFSPYAVAMYVGGEYHVFPETKNISEAATGVLAIMEELKKEGISINYDRDVRLVSNEAQMNAPDVTMRRLKKDSNHFYNSNSGKRYLQQGIDVTPTEDGYAFSTRGLIKFTYLSMFDESEPTPRERAAKFMDEYYKLLSMRRYGKTAAAIKQEVRRMTKDQAIKWIEETCKKFIRDGMEIFDIMHNLKNI